jgi:hypothetical protein
LNHPVAVYDLEIVCFPVATFPVRKHPVAGSAKSEASGGRRYRWGINFNVRRIETKALKIVAEYVSMYMRYMAHIHEKDRRDPGAGQAVVR